jgi:hypothetical protein
MKEIPFASAAEPFVDIAMEEPFQKSSQLGGKVVRQLDILLLR